MNEQEAEVRLRVWGEYACFSRPEFKVERVSYPVITPSAARGVLEAIFWKPEIRYEIRQVWILKPVRTMTVMRNEVADRMGETPIIIEDDRQRQQRTSLILKDVGYLILGIMRLRPHAKPPVYGYYDQFRRKVEAGQCFHRPYLGTREYAAFFGPATGREDAERQEFDLPIGNMLFDVAFVPDANHRDKLEFKRPDAEGKHVAVKGHAQALFFDANVVNGRLVVPPEKYDELRRMEDHHV